MEDIALPLVLAPERPRLEGQLTQEAAEAQARDLDTALGRTAEYGRVLWHQLDAVRHHLLDMLPDPNGDTVAERALTAPRGPSDDAGWDTWCTTYAAITSALAGPAGDSGWGRHEAHRLAAGRRGADHASERVVQLDTIADSRRTRVEEQLTDAVVPGHGANQSNLSRPAR